MIVITEDNKELLYNYVSSAKTICFDIESSGLSAYRDKVLCYMLGEPGKEFFVPANLDINPALFNKKELTGHNVKFDYVMTKRHERKEGNQLFDFEDTEFYDTQLGHQILFNGLGYTNSLAAVVDHWLGVYMLKDQRETFIGQLDYNFTESQMVYGVSDIRYLPRIKALQIKRLLEDQLDLVCTLETTLLPILGDMELEGCKIDKAKLLELEIEFTQELDRCIRELDAELVKLSFTHFPELAHTKYTRKRASIPTTLQASLFDFGNQTTKEIKKLKEVEKGKNKPNINYNSTKALPNLFNLLNLDPPIHSKTGKVSFGEDAINEYLTENPLSPFYDFLTKLLEMREFKGYISKYGKNSEFIKLLFKDFIHTTYSQCLTETGRLSSSNPNLQNIPKKGKGSKLRDVFVAEEGWSFITSDMAGQEARIAGELSGEPVLIDTFTKGLDIHKELATPAYSLIFGRDVTVDSSLEPFTVPSLWQLKAIQNRDWEGEITQHSYVPKALREDSKNALYGKFYGAGKNRIYAIYSKYINHHYQGEERLEIAGKVSKLIDSRLPVLKKYLEGRVRLVQKDGYIVTSRLGRRRYWNNPEKAYGDIMNAPIQGTGAESMKLAIVNVHNWCKETATKLGVHYRQFAYPIMNIHDELIVKMKDEYLEEYGKEPSRIITESLGYFLTKIPPKSDYKIAKKWEK